MDIEMSWIGLRLRKVVSNLIFGKKEIRIIMAGLDGVGKTTIIYKLKLGKLVTTKPSIGFEVETLEYNNIKFILWELGGQSRYSVIATISSPKRKISDLLLKIFTIKSCRKEPLIWKHKYLFNTNGLIFVVDSIDKDRVAEASRYLHRIMNKHEYRDAVLLIFANRQDHPNAMTNAEITEKLDLNSLGQSKWYIQSACTTTGDGLHQGLDWLCNNIDFTTKRMRSHQRHPR